MKTSCHSLQDLIQITLIFIALLNPRLSFKNNSISGFHNIKLIQSKRQHPNLKKLLPKAEYGEVLPGMFNCSDKGVNAATIS